MSDYRVPDPILHRLPYREFHREDAHLAQLKDWLEALFPPGAPPGHKPDPDHWLVLADWYEDRQLPLERVRCLTVRDWMERVPAYDWPESDLTVMSPGSLQDAGGMLRAVNRLGRFHPAHETWIFEAWATLSVYFAVKKRPRTISLAGYLSPADRPWLTLQILKLIDRDAAFLAKPYNEQAASYYANWWAHVAVWELARGRHQDAVAAAAMFGAEVGRMTATAARMVEWVRRYRDGQPRWKNPVQVASKTV